MPDAINPANKVTGRLLVLTAAVMWSTSGFFAKAPALAEWSPDVRGPLQAFWRAAFASLALLPLLRRPSWTWKLLPMVFFFAAMNVTFLTAMAYTEAAAVVWLQYTSPLWVFLVSVFVLRETSNRRDWLMLACGLVGVTFILNFELQGAAPLGVLFGLLAGVTFAGVILSLRQLRGHEPIWLVALNHLVTTCALAPYVAVQGSWPHDEQWLYLAGLGILQMGIPYVLFARGVRWITGHEASTILLLEPLLVPLWVFVAWRNTETYQAPHWWTLVGGGLILTGLLLRYSGKRQRISGEKSPIMPPLVEIDRFDRQD